MSHQAVQAVLERTLTDEEFRTRLFSQPGEALESYDLTPNEADALRALMVEPDAGESGQLDQRSSKSAAPPFWTQFIR